MMVNVILYKRGNEVITVVVTLKIEKTNITVITYNLQILFTKNVSLVKFYNKDHLNLKLVHYKKKLDYKISWLVLKSTQL